MCQSLEKQVPDEQEEGSKKFCVLIGTLKLLFPLSSLYNLSVFEVFSVPLVPSSKSSTEQKRDKQIDNFNMMKEMMRQIHGTLGGKSVSCEVSKKGGLQGKS